MKLRTCQWIPGKSSAGARLKNVGDLSAHFWKVEFACHCCGELKIEPGLIEALEQLRSLGGREIIVHDGYRCPTHNQAVGGVSNSEHTQGIAADIAIPGLRLQQIYELALHVPTFLSGGIGVYDTDFLHLDIRSHPARWARVRGQYVGIQQLVATPPALEARLLSKAQSTSQTA